MASGTEDGPVSGVRPGVEGVQGREEAQKTDEPVVCVVVTGALALHTQDLAQRVGMEASDLLYAAVCEQAAAIAASCRRIVAERRADLGEK